MQSWVLPYQHLFLCLPAFLLYINVAAPSELFLAEIVRTLGFLTECCDSNYNKNGPHRFPWSWIQILKTDGLAECGKVHHLADAAALSSFSEALQALYIMNQNSAVLGKFTSLWWMNGCNCAGCGRQNDCYHFLRVADVSLQQLANVGDTYLGCCCGDSLETSPKYSNNSKIPRSLYKPSIIGRVWHYLDVLLSSRHHKLPKIVFSVVAREAAF